MKKKIQHFLLVFEIFEFKNKNPMGKHELKNTPQKTPQKPHGVYFSPHGGKNPTKINVGFLNPYVAYIVIWGFFSHVSLSWGFKSHVLIYLL